MEHDLKYPVKYAVLELKEQGDWSNSFIDITRGYIVSKCYIVDTNTKYFADGKSDTTYNVVFPYDDIRAFKASIEKNDIEKNIGFKKVPSLNPYKEYSSAVKVNKVYDNYEDANQEANIKNEALRNNMPNNINAEMTELINEVGRNLAICLLFEQVVTENTKDMIVNDNQEKYR